MVAPRAVASTRVGTRVSPVSSTFTPSGMYRYRSLMTRKLVPMRAYMVKSSARATSWLFSQVMTASGRRARVTP